MIYKISTILLSSIFLLSCSNESNMSLGDEDANISIQPLVSESGNETTTNNYDNYSFADLQAGRHYEVLDDRQLFDREDGRVEVVEVFGYSCIHCSDLNEAILEKGDNYFGDNVKLIYVAAPFGGIWNEFAKAYYAGQEYEQRDEIHNRIFELIHKEQAFKRASAEDIAFIIANQFNIHGDEFLKHMESDKTKEQLNKALSYAQNMQVEGTPTIIVDGRYKIINQGNWHDTLDITKIISEHIINGDEGDRVENDNIEEDSQENLDMQIPVSEV